MVIYICWAVNGIELYFKEVRYLENNISSENEKIQIEENYQNSDN